MSEPTTARTAPQLVRASAKAFGDQPAIIDGEVVITFAGLAGDALQAARGFTALGIRPGDRVGLWAANSHRWVTAAGPSRTGQLRPELASAGSGDAAGHRAEGVRLQLQRSDADA